MEFQKEIPTTENRQKVIAKRFSCLWEMKILMKSYIAGRKNEY